MRTIYLVIFLVIFSSCKSESKIITAQEIIDVSFLASGADKVANSIIEFDFRDKKYLALRERGTFKLFRKYDLDGEIIEDIVTNDGYERLMNAHLISVIDSMAVKYASSVNSVHYFSVLPFGLNDVAVQKKLLNNVTIKNKDYYKVEITFTEDGGGEDFEDVYVYWIGKEDFKIDYLAYTFHVDGGGMRFREAINERVIEGIRFVDYNNFKTTNASTKLLDLDKAFENNQLEKLSVINLENVSVKLLN